MTADEQGAGPAGQPPSYVSGHVPASASLVQMRAEWIIFYDAQYHRVIRFVMQRGASLEDAQEAAHEALTESWMMMTTQPAKWRAITNQSAWIRTVAFRKYQRPPGPHIRPPLAADAELPDLPTPGPGLDEVTAQAQMVLQALRTLDEEARAVMAFTLDGFGTAEIAAELDISEQRVRDVKKKARTTLKRVLAVSNEGSEQR